jgi:hypothetical protein
VIFATTPWVAVVGTIGGALVTVLAGLATSFAARQWQRSDQTHAEREKLLADQREAYVGYLAAARAVKMQLLALPPVEVESTEQVYARLRAAREASPAVFEEIERAEIKLRLIGSTKVVQALDSFEEALTEEAARALARSEPLDWEPRESLGQAEASLLNAMRGE